MYILVPFNNGEDLSRGESLSLVTFLSHYLDVHLFCSIQEVSAKELLRPNELARDCGSPGNYSHASHCSSEKKCFTLLFVFFFTNK